MQYTKRTNVNTTSLHNCQFNKYHNYSNTLNIATQLGKVVFITLTEGKFYSLPNKYKYYLLSTNFKLVTKQNNCKQLNKSYR